MEEVITSILDMLAQSGVMLLLGRRLVSLLLGGLVVSEDKLLRTYLRQTSEEAYEGLRFRCYLSLLFWDRFNLYRSTRLVHFCAV